MEVDLLKHIAVRLPFAVLGVGCVKLPFSAVDSSEPAPVTDDREVRLTPLEQAGPEGHDGDALHYVSRLETQASPPPNVLIPENKQATWNGHNWCVKQSNSSEIFSCAPCAAVPFCAPHPTAVPGN